MRISKILFLLFMLLPVSVFSQEDKYNKFEFNYGIKLGFHAATYNTTDFQIDGYNYDDRVIQSNRIGYSVAPFARITKNRFYLQTETNFSISRYYFEFEEDTNLPNPATPTYELTTYCMQIPLLLGYNFVQSGAYGMSVFTGPKTKLIFTSLSKQNYDNFKYSNLYESLRKVTYYWEIGLGINIANFFFDFVYDIGLRNNTHGIINGSTGEIYYAKRSDNLLNFSVGIMF